MKATTLLMTLALGMAAFSFGQDQGGPPPGAGRQGGPGMRGPGGPQNGLAPLERLVFRKDVQDDIQVTDDQKTKLDDLRETMRPQGGPGGGGPGGPPPQGGGGQGGPPPADMPSQQGDQGGPPPQGGPGGRGPNQEQRAKFEAAIKAILTSDQLTRVHQIAIQLAGSKAVLDKSVQADLALTSDQKTQIASVAKAQGEANRGLFEKAQSGDLDREQMQEAMKANDKVFQSKLSAILTGDQSAKLQSMAGKAFKATEEDHFGGPPPPPGGGGQGGGGQ